MAQTYHAPVSIMAKDGCFNNMNRYAGSASRDSAMYNVTILGRTPRYNNG